MGSARQSSRAFGAVASIGALSGIPSTKPYPPPGAAGSRGPGSSGASQASLCGLALGGAVWTGILFRYGRVLWVENLTKCVCQAKSQNVFR